MVRTILYADTGIDDALAIAYLLASPEVELTAIVASYGNVSMQTAKRNTEAILNMFGRSDIPVWEGATKPSWAEAFIPDTGCTQFHGINGLAELDARDYGSSLSTAGAIIPDALTRAVAAAARTESISIGGYRLGSAHAIPAWDIPGWDMPAQDIAAQDTSASDLSSNEHAQNISNPDKGLDTLSEGARATIHAIRHYGSDIVLISTGPLTDIAAAVYSAPQIAQHCRIVGMGGALTQPGNCYDGVSETNIIQDPESAARVFSSGADVTLIGLDVTHQCLLSTSDVATWRSDESDISSSIPAHRSGDFLVDLIEFSAHVNAECSSLFSDGMPLHDPLAAAAAVDPNLVGTFNVALTAQTGNEPEGGIRGRTVGDPYRLLTPETPRVKVALSVQTQTFLRRFVERINTLVHRRHQ